MLKRLDLIGRSRILERVQLYVREVTRPSFSGRLKGVACETKPKFVALLSFCPLLLPLLGSATEQFYILS